MRRRRSACESGSTGCRREGSPRSSRLATPSSDELLEARIVADRVEIGVALAPFADGLGLHLRRTLERVERAGGLAGQRAEAGEVVVRRGRVRVLAHVLLDVGDGFWGPHLRATEAELPRRRLKWLARLRSDGQDGGPGLGGHR